MLACTCSRSLHSGAVARRHPAPAILGQSKSCPAPLPVSSPKDAARPCSRGGSAARVARSIVAGACVESVRTQKVAGRDVVSALARHASIESVEARTQAGHPQLHA